MPWNRAMCALRVDTSQITHIDGFATYPNDVSARVCIRPKSYATEKSSRSPRSKKRDICAIGSNKNRASACRDACQCACAALFQHSQNAYPWQWISNFFRRTACTKLCIPACSQPGRVVRSEFAGPL